MTLEHKLLARRRIDPATGCWIWSGGVLKLRGGYGRIVIRGREFRVYRVAAHVFLGMPLESDEFVLHECDNPPCFNPDHLKRGDHGENMREAADRLRFRSGATSHRPNRKLDWLTVRAIRAAHAAGEGGYRRLAVRFNIDRSNIARVVTCQTWWPEPDGSDPNRHLSPRLEAAVA